MSSENDENPYEKEPLFLTEEPDEYDVEPEEPEEPEEREPDPCAREPERPAKRPDIETAGAESHIKEIVEQGAVFDDGWVIKNDRLKPRHRTLARLLADGRYTQTQISKHINYRESWITQLKKNPLIRQEISRYQERAFQADHSQRMKDLAGDAIDVIEETIRDTSGAVKPAEKQAAAKWLIEKVTGKAVQIHDVGESTLTSVLDAIDKINSGKPVDALSFDKSTKDVTPATPEREENPLKKWVIEEI